LSSLRRPPFIEHERCKRHTEHGEHIEADEQTCKQAECTQKLAQRSKTRHAQCLDAGKDGGKYRTERQKAHRDEAIAWNMPTPALPGAPESASKEEERAQDVHGDSDGTHIPWQQIQRRLTVYSLCLCAMGSDIGSERWRHRIDQEAECHIERQDSNDGRQ